VGEIRKKTTKKKEKERTTCYKTYYDCAPHGRRK